jgi:antitoxin (DNA-binding transcriptional repressor) of toxin-antitoxin stability system
MADVKSITPLDLRRSLGRILDEASAGERFLIERDRRPLAVLVSVEDASRLDVPDSERHARREAALRALEAYRARIAPLVGTGQTGAGSIRSERDALDERDRRRAAGDVPGLPGAT